MVVKNDESEFAFAFPLYEDPRSDAKFLHRQKIITCNRKFAQCDIVKDCYSLPKTFFLYASRVPDAVCVQYYGEVVSIRELVNMIGYDWLPGNFVGIFVLHYERLNPIVVAPVIPPVVQKNAPKYFLFSIRGPSAKDMRFAHSPMPCEGYELPFKEGTAVFKEDDTITDDMEMENYIKAQVFSHAFAERWKNPRFHSDDYYVASSYSAWSFGSHVRQWKKILEKIPIGDRLVAPGDGCGVLASLRDGTVVSGDLHVDVTSHPAVRKETITETLQRAAQMQCDTDTWCMLSYVSHFLTQDDWMFLGLSGWKVVICDFKHVIREELTGMEIVGPGVVAYANGHQMENIEIQSDIHEFREKKPAPIMYTENLLRLENVCIVSMSPTVDYLFDMCPKAKYVSPNPLMREYARRRGIEVTAPLGGETVLCSYIADLERFAGHVTYFAPVGKVVEIEILSGYDLVSRKVYVTDNNPRNLRLFGSVNCKQANDKLYVYYHEDKDFAYTAKYVSRTEATVVNITFKRKDDSFVPRVEIIGKGYHKKMVVYYAEGMTFVTTRNKVREDLLHLEYCDVTVELVKAIKALGIKTFDDLDVITSSVSAWYNAGGKVGARDIDFHKTISSSATINKRKR